MNRKMICYHGKMTPSASAVIIPRLLTQRIDLVVNDGKPPIAPIMMRAVMTAPGHIFTESRGITAALAIVLERITDPERDERERPRIALLGLHHDETEWEKISRLLRTYRLVPDHLPDGIIAFGRDEVGNAFDFVTKLK